jgi:hypothetical protein
MNFYFLEMINSIKQLTWSDPNSAKIKLICTPCLPAPVPTIIGLGRGKQAHFNAITKNVRKFKALKLLDKWKYML